VQLALCHIPRSRHGCFGLAGQVISNLCDHLSFHRPRHLLSEDISENATDHGDDGEEEEEDEVGEEEALDLLDRGEPAEAGEEDHEDGGDEDGVGGVHVQPVPKQLLKEGLVMHRPEAESKKNYAAHQSKGGGGEESPARPMLTSPHLLIFPTRNSPQEIFFLFFRHEIPPKKSSDSFLTQISPPENLKF